MNQRTLTPQDTEWPAQLAIMGDDAPDALHIHGNGSLADLSADSFLLTGSRACTAYGERVTHELASYLHTQGRTIVTTHGYGIAQNALAASLTADASGPLRHIGIGFGPVGESYPSPLQNLVTQLVEAGGLWVTIFPPTELPTRSRFLYVARFAAALASRTVLIEATFRATANVAAHAAASYGRPLYAVPGPITSAASYGPNSMIAAGEAKAIANVTDLVAVPTD